MCMRMRAHANTHARIIFVLLLLVDYCIYLFILVKVKLKTTSCKNSCTNFNDRTCPSSILVDNKEMSYQRDGFNIVIIDNYTGKVVKRKYLKWFNNLMFWRRSEFKKFFKTVQHNSTIIIVFQNMCKQVEQDWYNSLHDIKHSIPMNLHPYQAAVIACKGTCPQAIGESIPYTYYSTGVEFVKSITLLFIGEFILFVCLSLSVSACLSVCLSVSVCLSLCLSVCLSVCLFVLISKLTVYFLLII